VGVPPNRVSSLLRPPPGGLTPEYDYTILAAMPHKRRVKKRRGEEMTTTVTLPVELMQRARIAAVKRQTSFKALVAEGLRAVLARQEEKT
jgi:hypothetical protein